MFLCQMGLGRVTEGILEGGKIINQQEEQCSFLFHLVKVLFRSCNAHIFKTYICSPVCFIESLIEILADMPLH